MTALQRPPIPQAPLVDQNGFVTREWWRWFQSIGVVVTGSDATIQTVSSKVAASVGVDLPLPMLDDPVDVGDAFRLGRELTLLQDPVSAATSLVDFSQAALNALELSLLSDPLPLDQLGLAPLELAVPPDTPAIEQALLAALMLDRPADPPPVPGAYSSNSTNTGNLTTATPVNGASLLLAPGDYDLTLFAAFSAIGGTVNATGLACGTSTTSATFDGSVPHFATMYTPTTINSAIGALSMSLGPVRYNLTAAATIYGVVEAFFTLGTGSALQCTAYLSARKWH